MKRDLHRLVATNVEMRYGFPIIFDDGPVYIFGVKFLDACLARATGFWPRKRIIVNHAIRNLPLEQQIAVLVHEVGHCILLHMERRLFGYAWRWWTRAAEEGSQAHEFEADAFVVVEGYGPAMAAFLSRPDIAISDGDAGSPSSRARIDAIRELMKGQIHVAQAA